MYIYVFCPFWQMPSQSDTQKSIEGIGSGTSSTSAAQNMSGATSNVHPIIRCSASTYADVC